MEINVAQIKKAKALTGVNVYGLVNDRGAGPLQELQQDVIAFVDLLYVLCEDQAKAESVSDEDFGRGLAGDSLAEAGKAFVRELIDFFPQARTRKVLTHLLDRTERFEEANFQKAMRKLEELTDERIEEMMQKMPPPAPGDSNDLSGSAPASSESTPAP